VKENAMPCVERGIAGRVLREAVMKVIVNTRPFLPVAERLALAEALMASRLTTARSML
jgi:hypothetical protein